ncbi:MAG TPA: hypothetical protein VFO94_00700, partial [Gammaproteobacteria bacterium]|nr:hypothetical protein [Gammaproteobacteria bacterium]
MKRMILLRTGFISMVIGFLALQASAAFAQARQLSPELRAKLTAGYEEMRRQNPQLADRSPEQIAADLDALS